MVPGKKEEKDESRGKARVIKRIGRTEEQKKILNRKGRNNYI